MKTTVDIPDNELNDIMRYSGAATKKEAITLAIAEYNRRHRLNKLATNLRGTFDSMMTGDELISLREDEIPFRPK